MKLISTYQDANFYTTVKESYAAIINDENVVIFPEKSPDGYVAELQGFYAGFIVFAQCCLRHGVDVPIFVSYYKKKEHVYVFDKPILFSQLKAQAQSRDEMVKFLLDKCNNLNYIDLAPYLSNDKNATK